MPRRYYSSTAVATTLSASANNSTTSITVAALSGYPTQTPWTAIIDPDTASEEVVTVTNVSGTTLTVTRGVDGTSAVSHNAGAVFRHGVSARDFDEANDHVNSSGDVHTQYVAKSLVNAKGDLVTATANDTPAIQSVGANGEVLYADSSATNGLRWQPPYNAGRNRIINGNFSVWQRGTSFTNPGVSGGAVGYTADRWLVSYDATPNWTISQQSFTAGSAPESGYESAFFCRAAAAHTSNSTYRLFGQRIEDVRTFANQTVTISAWLKTTSNFTLPSVALQQDFGSGGSSAVTTTVASNVSITTAWQRFTWTVAVPSIAGKTLGSGSFLMVFFNFPLSAAATLDVWGVQVEAGNVATRFEEEPFEATLRKCQRYYYRTTAATTNGWFAQGLAASTTGANVFLHPPVTMRVKPTAIDHPTIGNFRLTDSVSGYAATGSLGLQSDSTPNMLCIFVTVASGLTQYRPYQLSGNSANETYIGFSAEL